MRVRVRAYVRARAPGPAVRGARGWAGRARGDAGPGGSAGPGPSSRRPSPRPRPCTLPGSHGGFLAEEAGKESTLYEVKMETPRGPRRPRRSPCVSTCAAAPAPVAQPRRPCPCPCPDPDGGPRHGSRSRVAVRSGAPPGVQGRVCGVQGLGVDVRSSQEASPRGQKLRITACPSSGWPVSLSEPPSWPPAGLAVGHSLSAPPWRVLLSNRCRVPAH